MTYAITNCYSLKDDMKKDGAKWDSERKAWIIDDATFEKYQSRTSGYSAKWWTAWQSAVKEAV